MTLKLVTALGLLTPLVAFGQSSAPGDAPGELNPGPIQIGLPVTPCPAGFLTGDTVEEYGKKADPEVTSKLYPARFSFASFMDVIESEAIWRSCL